MASHTIGIIVNGATGRIGSTQHLANALIPIIAEGGLALGDDRLVPRLLLTGRDAARLAAVARAHKLADWTIDLDAALADPTYAIFFDAAATQGHVAALEKAIAAGKHVYCEKPVAQPCQRPSWNYRAGGGGIILDMYPHWRYVIETIVGRIVRVASSAWIATPERVDERGERNGVAVEDSAATLLELEGGTFGTIVSSWATRVRRDDLLTLQVDGSKGSAVAGLHRCQVQSMAHTPAIAHFSVMRDIGADYREALTPAPPLERYCNPYRVGWEAFLRHVAADAGLRATSRPAFATSHSPTPAIAACGSGAGLRCRRRSMCGDRDACRPRENGTWTLLRRTMDARVKPAHDGGISQVTPRRRICRSRRSRAA